MKAILLAFLMQPLFAADKPAREITEEDRKQAYAVSLQCIQAKLKAPSTAKYQPYEEASITPGGAGHRDWIIVRILVDAQNTYGATLRSSWYSRVSPPQGNGTFKAFCTEERR